MQITATLPARLDLDPATTSLRGLVDQVDYWMAQKNYPKVEETLRKINDHVTATPPEAADAAYAHSRFVAARDEITQLNHWEWYDYLGTILLMFVALIGLIPLLVDKFTDSKQKVVDRLDAWAEGDAYTADSSVEKERKVPAWVTAGFNELKKDQKPTSDLAKALLDQDANEGVFATSDADFFKMSAGDRALVTKHFAEADVEHQAKFANMLFQSESLTAADAQQLLSLDGRALIGLSAAAVAKIGPDMSRTLIGHACRSDATLEDIRKLTENLIGCINHCGLESEVEEATKINLDVASRAALIKRLVKGNSDGSGDFLRIATLIESARGLTDDVLTELDPDTLERMADKIEDQIDDNNDVGALGLLATVKSIAQDDKIDSTRRLRLARAFDLK